MGWGDNLEVMSQTWTLLHVQDTTFIPCGSWRIGLPYSCSVVSILQPAASQETIWVQHFPFCGIAIFFMPICFQMHLCPSFQGRQLPSIRPWKRTGHLERFFCDPANRSQFEGPYSCSSNLGSQMCILLNNLLIMPVEQLGSVLTSPVIGTRAAELGKPLVRDLSKLLTVWGRCTGFSSPGNIACSWKEVFLAQILTSRSIQLKMKLSIPAGLS